MTVDNGSHTFWPLLARAAVGLLVLIVTGAATFALNASIENARASAVTAVRLDTTEAALSGLVRREEIKDLAPAIKDLHGAVVELRIAIGKIEATAEQRRERRAASAAAVEEASP